MATSPDAVRSAPVTVVIALRVKSGREGDFRQWQDGMNRTVAAFAGFLGTEVVPPGGEGGEGAVLYRFDSKPHLEAWLASPKRREAMRRGADLFEAPGSQQVLVGEHDDELVTAVVSHRVDPALVDDFLAWRERVTAAERACAGFSTSQLFRPVPGVQEDWTAVFSFDTEKHLDERLESPERKTLLDEGQRFEDFDLHRISSPFGSWFSSGRDGAADEAPAQWKTALSVLVGLYPTVVLLTLCISELWKDGELWETLLLGNVLSVALLTWVVMPIVTRALRFWLAPDRGRAGPRRDSVGAAVSVGFLTFAAAGFWLVTTQVWSLP